MTERVGRAIATKVLTAVLDRIAFMYSVAIEDSQIISSWFTPVTPLPGEQGQPHSGDLGIAAQQAEPVVDIHAADLKAELERTTLPAEPFCSSYRLALQPRSLDEKFMHLYSLLLRIFEDEQALVDAFIVGENPNVTQTPDPRPRANRMETVYTRLRNESRNPRAGVNLADIKTDMANRVPELASLTKRAIGMQP